MANAYYDYINGSAGNDGLTPTTAKATRDQAVAVAGAGDKVIAVDGTQQHESADFVFDDNIIESSETYRQATLIAADTETGEVARTSSALQAANNPKVVENLVFDGSQGNPPSRAFTIVADTAEDIITDIQGCRMISGSVGALYLTDRRGTQRIVNLSVDGNIPDHAVYVDGNQAASGDQLIQINGLQVLPTNEIQSNQELIDLRGLAANNLDLIVNGLEAKINVAASASSVYLAKLKSNSKIHLNGGKIEINGDDANGVTGIVIQGHSAGNEPSEVFIQNQRIDFNCPAGYGLAVGEAQIDGHLTSGTVSGCVLNGKHFASATPHTVCLGQGTNTTFTGNTLSDGGVPILVSKVDDAKVINNVVINPFITGIFIKGATDSTVENNVVIHNGSNPCRASLLCAVDDQAGTDTVASTIKNNVVLVKNISKINTLSARNDASQVCTFENNIYILPDTVDLATTDLFGESCGAGGAANRTFAEWQAEAYTTNEKVVQLPVTQIDVLIKQFTEIQAQGSGLFTSLFRSI